MEVQNCTYTPNFKAKFVPKVKLNKERWEKVAEIFEKKTQNYPNDTLYMTDGGERMWSVVTETQKNGKKIKKTHYDHHYFFSTHKNELKKGNEETYEWFASDVIGNMLVNYTDNEIASKLVKIFKQCKKADVYSKKLKALDKTCKTEKEFERKSGKLDSQYFAARKDFYEKDNVLEKAADYYDIFI